MKQVWKISVLCGLLVTILCGTASAAIVDSGECGDNVTWTLDDTGTLAIKGTGRMDSIWSISNVPWYDYRYDIENITIDEGITNISNFAFEKLSNITSIFLPDSIEEIGTQAFCNCDSLRPANKSQGVISNFSDFSYRAEKAHLSRPLSIEFFFDGGQPYGYRSKRKI